MNSGSARQTQVTSGHIRDQNSSDQNDLDLAVLREAVLSKMADSGSLLWSAMVAVFALV